MAGNVVVKMLPFKDPRSKDRGNSNAAHIDYIARRPGTDKSITEDSLHKMASMSALISSDEKYISYIGTRPGAVKGGAHGVHPAEDHGLFGEFGVPDLRTVQREVRNLNNSPMYRLIVSLTDTTAAELGFTTKESWETLIRSQIHMLSQNMIIPENNLSWVAALHLKDGHPHVHLSLWDRTDSKRYKGLTVLPKDNLKAIRVGFTKGIYAERRLELYAVKTASRNMLTEMIKKDVDQLRALFADKSTIPNEEISMPAASSSMINHLSSDIVDLSKIMPGSGRISYEFMSPEVKANVNEIVGRILTNSQYSEHLQKVQKSASELAAQYSTNSVKIAEAATKATDDIRKRMSQIVLRAAADLNAENAKSMMLYSMFEGPWKNRMLNLNPADSVFYIRQMIAAGIDHHDAASILPNLLSSESIGYAKNYFKIGANEGINSLIDKVAESNPRIRPDDLKKFWSRVDEKAELEKEYKSRMEKRIVNTVSMGVLRSVFSLFNSYHRRKKLNSFFMNAPDQRPRKHKDSLYTQDELE